MVLRGPVRCAFDDFPYPLTLRGWEEAGGLVIAVGTLQQESGMRSFQYSWTRRPVKAWGRAQVPRGRCLGGRESPEDRLRVGLAFTQAIVEQHGGRLDVVSEPGGGTYAQGRLPLRD